MSWAEKLSQISGPVRKHTPKHIMVRPKKKETIEWVLSTAARYRVSANALVDAILEAEMEKSK